MRVSSASKASLEHPGDETISAFLERRLEANTAARFEEHLADCDGCRHLVAEAASAGDGEDSGEATWRASGGGTLPLDAEPPRGIGSPDEERVGAVLAKKWTLRRLLGVGGMAVVYEAVHNNGHVVALKLLRRHLAAHREVRSRFVREGYVANRVAHPSAVTILDDGLSAEGTPFLVMERLEGETLAAWLDREGPRRWDELRPLVFEALAVLEAAHAKGIVHRDIKPSNLFVTRNGDTKGLKLLDFGIAHLQEPTDGARTETGVGFGTPAFMSPEQARGERKVDGRSDLWSLAATVARMLSGKPLFEADTPRELAFRVATTEAPPISRLCEHVPPRVAKVLDRALRLRAAERFHTAAEMRAALEESETTQRTTRTRAALVVGATTLLLATATATGDPLRVAVESRSAKALLREVDVAARASLVLDERKKDDASRRDLAARRPAGSIMRGSVTRTRADERVGIEPAAPLASPAALASTSADPVPDPYRFRR